MNKQTFIQLIRNPSEISSEQLLELEKVVAGFPYCQAAYILMAKQAGDNGSMLADQRLKKASAYTLDRKNLKKLLTGKKELTPVEFKETFETSVPVLTITEEPALIGSEEKTEIPFSEITNKREEPEIHPVITEERSTAKGALTDQQRDQIIAELKENLKNLHEKKSKAAEENDIEEATLPEENLSVKNLVPENTIPALPIENATEVLSDLSDLLDNSPYTYPIRTEDVAVDIKETEADTDLLLEYLDFLEEKRGIFRKNKKKEVAIINKIIKEDPTIPKLDINNLPDNSVDLSTKSITITKEPVSENFAKILGLQGKKDKAIEIYEQLILKNPEKKPYFEALIEKLKNKI